MRVCKHCNTDDRKRLKSGAKGYCGVCYKRWRRHGDPSVVKYAPPSETGVCSVDGCEREFNANGYCTTHENRWKKHGNPLAHKPVRTSPRHVDRTQPCSVDGCDSPIGDGSNGMCRPCYRKTRYVERHEHYRAKVRARRSVMRRATPPWANERAIYRFYRKCPPGHEVDHVVPLQGLRVSGLHVRENLQYLPVRKNRQKSNRHAG